MPDWVRLMVRAGRTVWQQQLESFCKKRAACVSYDICHKNVQKSFCHWRSWWSVQLLCPYPMLILSPFRPGIYPSRWSTGLIKSSLPYIRVSQPLHYWHFAPDNSWLWGLSCALWNILCSLPCSYMLNTPRRNLPTPSCDKKSSL